MDLARIIARDDLRRSAVSQLFAHLGKIFSSGTVKVDVNVKAKAAEAMYLQVRVICRIRNGLGENPRTGV